MAQPPNIRSYLKKLSFLHRQFNCLSLLLTLLAALMLGSLLTILWTLLRPPQVTEALIVFITGFLAAVFFNKPRRRKQPTEDDFLLYLDMQHLNTRHSAFRLKDETSPADSEWQAIIQDYLTQQKKRLQQALIKPSWTLVIALSLLIFSSYVTPPSWSYLIKTARQQLNPPKKIATLLIKQGSADPEVTSYALNPNTPHAIKLLADNLVQLIIQDHHLQHTPYLLLKENGGDHIYQSFQMQKQATPEQVDTTARYQIEFALTQSLDLYIPVVDAQHKLASFITEFPQHPQVRLQSPQANHPNWIDEKPITLTIDVTAKKALKEVNLIIQTPHSEHKEPLRHFDKQVQQVSIPYSLILEPYLETDLTRVTLIAEAIDRSSPNALVGYSQPIELTVVSAYGRYLKTLQQLHQLKTTLDHHQSTLNPKLSHESVELMQEAQQNADTTPFFDHLDRHQLQKLNTLLQTQQKKSTMSSLYELSQELTRFLEEHERLNDRERDRDFLIAAQGLSAALAASDHVTNEQIKHMIDRMQNFLDQRHPHWQLRVKRLDDPEVTPSWPKISKTKPFKETLSKIQDALKQENKASAQAQVDPMMDQYQSWLDELEQAEDKQREELRKKMQEEFKALQQQLKQLQKKQSEISSQLDKAQDKEKATLDDDWPMIKLKQAANLKDTKKLEATINQLVPQAGQRLSHAANEMSLTMEQGEQEQFIQAESHSDAANRLLRAAHQDSMKQEKQQQEQRSRQRRRLGRKYHGRALYNSDINLIREYQVDRKYREDILDEIQDSQYHERHKAILDNYLRRIIR